MIAGDPKEHISWREVLRRGTLSPSLKRWSEHMPSAECPECKGNFAEMAAPAPPTPAPAPEVKPKRKYTKRSERWKK